MGPHEHATVLGAFDAKPHADATDRVLELGDEISVVEGLLKERLDLFDTYYEAQRAGG